MSLLTPTLIRQICDESEIYPSKRLGQNFMVDGSQVSKIVRLAEIKSDDSVLEIGPGLGSLTLGLLETGAHVTAVELDPKLVKLLPETVEHFDQAHSENLTVLHKDALMLKPADLARPSDSRPLKLVANLPYNVGTQILLTLLERFPNIESALVLVQAEVADRLVASPGSRTYGIPSAKLAWFGKASPAGLIPRSAFWPVPRVDSKLVRFEKANSTKLPSIPSSETREETFSLINLAFSQRRKTLRSLLTSQGYSTDTVRDVFDSLQIDPMVRGEALDLQQFRHLAQRLAN